MRISWNQYFLKIARIAAERSTCLRRQVGAVIVRDKIILSTGYNGAPKGHQHCADVGCIRTEKNIPSGQNHEICMAIHAEQNAIIQAAKNGVCVNKSSIYCTLLPCSICTKMLINAGVLVIYYIEGYPDPLTKMLIDKSPITLIKLEE